MTIRFARAGLLVAAVALAPIGANAEEFINILTGGTGGVYYPLGVAISKIYAEKIPGAKPSVQSTKASVENLNLLQAGKGEIAFTLGDLLADAWNGNAEVGFKTKLDKLRTRRRDLSELHPDRRAQGRRTSTRSPISRASGCRSARRSRAPSSMRARSWPAPACRTRISARSNICRSANRSS